MAQTITRKQLQAYGLSRYHAQVLTKELDVLGKEGLAYIYDLAAVIGAIKLYGERSRIRPATRGCLQRTLTELLQRLGNVVHVVFESGTDDTIQTLATKLHQAMAKTDASLAALKADANEIEQRYGLRHPSV